MAFGFLSNLLETVLEDICPHTHESCWKCVAFVLVRFSRILLCNKHLLAFHRAGICLVTPGQQVDQSGLVVAYMLDSRLWVVFFEISRLMGDGQLGRALLGGQQLCRSSPETCSASECLTKD